MAKLNMVVSIVLRAVAAAAAMAAAIKMGSAHDSAQFLTLKFEAKYTNSPSFKYFVIVNSVVTCYSVIALLVLILPYKALLCRILLFLDTFVTFMLGSSFSAAVAMAYVGKKGNSHAGWLPICGQVPKFCSGATGALISAFIAMLLYFLLLIYSLYGALTPLFTFKE
ncbi:hypothetical protein V2J09_006508 [Rumex salicifolius]